jgi:hypothetical protein
MKNNLIKEELVRIKTLMGLIIESEKSIDDCYPSDYEHGKKYERETLSKIFSCIAGEENFPYEAVMEWVFPLLPPYGENKRHHSVSYDPKNIQVGPNEFIDMEERVRRTTNGIESVNLEKFSITPKMIHMDTTDFFPEKKNAPGYKERVNHQKERVIKNGEYSLTENEPFVVEFVDGKYKWSEGWHRLLALVELYEEGKIDSIKGYGYIIKRKSDK